MTDLRPTAGRPISTASAVTILVGSSIGILAAWLMLATAGLPATVFGSLGALPIIVLVVTLFVLTRRAERSIADRTARTRHVGWLCAIGMGLLGIQAVVVGKMMNVLTTRLALWATGTVLISVAYVVFLVRSGEARR